MTRGTTPTHTFVVPIDASDVAKIRVIYSQRGQVILAKDYDTYQDGKLVVQLSQEETLDFSSTQPVYIQLRVLTLAGEALASEVICTCAAQLLEDEVLA